MLCRWQTYPLTKSRSSSADLQKGEHKDLRNWRPITLLNTDYKIIAKVMANRLGKVLNSIIDPAQTSCSIPGRCILDNVVITRDIIDYCEAEELQSAIINTNQEKAFDRVNHTYLNLTLGRFGFGDHFKSWIKLLYQQRGSHIIVNGWKTRLITISPGVRQGCPLSPLLQPNR